MATKRELYSPLLSERELDDEFDGRLRATKQPNRLASGLRLVYLIAIHVALLLLAASVYTSWLWRGDQTDFKLLPAELPFARDFVEYEEVIFAPSGFNDLDGPATLYEGRPNPENDALWLNLTRGDLALAFFGTVKPRSDQFLWANNLVTTVGMASLTEDEYNQLDITTLQAVNKPDQRLVTIEVFHQLHCLNYLRRRIYEEEGEHFQIESDWSREAHISHCIDYLRQVLMCHGDLTPITLELAPHKYKPNFSIKHSCRNWDRVYEFATERNISGTVIE